MSSKRRARTHVPPVEPTVSPVTFNAVKHGIFSVSPVVPWVESEGDWTEFRDSIFESLQPKGGLEIALADRVACLLWRLMRTVRYERESIASGLYNVRGDFEAQAAMAGKPVPASLDPDLKRILDMMGMLRLLPDEDVINKVMRYETRLHRHLLQTLHQMALIKGFRTSLPHNSKRGVANLDPPAYNRNKAALSTGPSLTTPT